MPLSHFGDFDCDSTSNQCVVQSPQSLHGVSVESQSMANPPRMRCELISTNVSSTAQTYSPFSFFKHFSAASAPIMLSRPGPT